MLTVNWIKSTQNAWLRLDLPITGLSEGDTTGVYVIWHGGQTPRTVRVGQGDVCKRLNAHKSDTAITAYSSYGLYVTWAAVSFLNLDAVERYLADQLRPLVGDRYPDVVPLSVNLPWAA